MSNYLAFSLVIFFLLSLVTFCRPNCENLIDDTCKTCSREDPNVNYEFCTTSLKTAPCNQSAVTLNGLGKISINLLENNVTDTWNYTKQLINLLENNVTDTWNYTKQLIEKESGPNMKKVLADCVVLYDDAIPTAKQGMSLYKAGQFYDANFKITAVMDAATTCKNGFRERNVSLSEMTKRNNDTFELGAIVLSIMHIQQHY